MSKELLAISFLKEKGISYYLEQKDGKINFSCLYCGGTAVMEVINTKWNCSQCSSIGNLVTLTLLKEEKIKKEKVFNPREDKRRLNNKINRILNRLVNQQTVYQELQSAKIEMNNLINKLIEK
jgi:ribosomal protein L37AE/L43A